MESFQLGDLHITLDKKGANAFSKVSYPLRYGRFAEIRTPEYIYHFNLNGEIKYIQGLGKDWPDPSEWLKRTIADDWVYYSTGGYSGVFDSTGEYYLPCLSYPSNSINFLDPFKDNCIKRAIDSWHDLYKKIRVLYTDSMSRSLSVFLGKVLRCSPQALEMKSRRLHEILGGPVTVLPPDTRHVDYEVIPLILADGCLYKCGFCRVKTNREFRNRTRDNIRKQVGGLKELYDLDICNYNSLFLGQHDALHSGMDYVEFAARLAYEEFSLKRSHLKGCFLFLFGSADSLIESDLGVFDRLEKLPFSTYINIGLESADPETLHTLGKAITPGTVYEAFERSLEINRKYEKVEITVNFLLSDELPQGHLPSLFRLIDKTVDKPPNKGAVYFSPLISERTGEKRGIKRQFYRIKARTRLPAYLYLIQRM